MDIKTKVINQTLNIMLIGELDEYSAEYIRDLLDKEINNKTYTDVVFDLTELEFMDSTGIGVLIGRYKKLKSKNKRVYISNPSKTVEKIFNMSGIYEIMPKIS